MIEALIQIIDILFWNKKRFPNNNVENQELKVREEMDEFLKELENHTRSRNKKHFYELKMEQELTDVLIASIGLLRYKKYRELVKFKMICNKHRTFENNHHK